MGKRVQWLGPPEAQCRALTEHGYELVVVPEQEYELPAELAESLVASSADWHALGWSAEPKPPTVAEIVAGIAELTEDELAALAEHKSVQVKRAAATELERRAGGAS